MALSPDFPRARVALGTGQVWEDISAAVLDYSVDRTRIDLTVAGAIPAWLRAAEAAVRVGGYWAVWVQVRPAEGPDYWGLTDEAPRPVPDVTCGTGGENADPLARRSGFTLWAVPTRSRPEWTLPTDGR